MISSTDPDQLLRQALDCLIDARVDLDGYTFSPAAGATQATVWKGVAKDDEQPTVALRLTPKPLELIRRIATLVDGVQSVVCPTTAATGRLQVGERTWTVHLCTWIGIGAPHKADMRLLGEHLPTRSIRRRPSLTALTGTEPAMKIGIIGMGHVGATMQALFQPHADIVTFDVADDRRTPTTPSPTATSPSSASTPHPTRPAPATSATCIDAVKRLPTQRVLLKSTVPPGTTDDLAEATGKTICFSPEYVGESTYHQPFWTDSAAAVPFLILGGPRRCPQLLHRRVPAGARTVQDLLPVRRAGS